MHIARSSIFINFIRQNRRIIKNINSISVFNFLRIEICNNDIFVLKIMLHPIFVDGVFVMRQTAFLSYTMTTADANNPRGVVPVGRQFDFIGDVETELMILNDGDESLCLGYDDVDFFEEVFVGDHLNYHATMLKVGGTSRQCLIQTFKVATMATRLGVPGAKETDVVYFDRPKLVAEGKVTLVVKKERQRGVQPDGVVKDPWKVLSSF